MKSSRNREKMPLAPNSQKVQITIFGDQKKIRKHSDH